MDLSPAIATAIAAAVSVPLFMALMRRIKSFQHRPDPGKSFEQLAREYQKWEILSVLISILLVALIGYLIWLMLTRIYGLQLTQHRPGLFVIAVPAMLWVLPALFFALFIAAIPLHYLYLAILGKRRYAEYIEYGDQKFRINTWKLFRYMGNFLLPICLVFTFLALNTYARVTDRAFVINPFFGLNEVTYRFVQIQSIELVRSFQAPNGDIVRNPYYVVKFDDGSEYNFHRTVTEMTFAQQQDLANYLLEATQLNLSINDPYPS